MARRFHVTTKSLKARLGRSCGRSLNCSSPNLFPPCHLNSFQTPTRHNCLNHTSPIVFFVSSHLSSLPKRWEETPHPLDNPCNNYFGISCFTMVTITRSIVISIAMALVPFKSHWFTEGIDDNEALLDQFLALRSSVSGISCYATVIVTCSIATSITMALVPFNLISLPKGLTIKPF